MSQDYRDSTPGPSVPALEDLLQLVEQLPIGDRVELLKQLIGKQSGLNVVLDTTPFSGPIANHVNAMDPDQLGDLLKAIADRVANEGR